MCQNMTPKMGSHFGGLEVDHGSAGGSSEAKCVGFGVMTVQITMDPTDPQRRNVLVSGEIWLKGEMRGVHICACIVCSIHPYGMYVLITCVSMCTYRCTQVGWQGIQGVHFGCFEPVLGPKLVDSGPVGSGWFRVRFGVQMGSISAMIPQMHNPYTRARVQ